PGTGDPGLTQTSGDLDDYYSIELLAGQTITLLVADFNVADVDLYLFSTDGEILDFSVEEGEIETLVVPADGTYIVNVFAFFGASNYILAIGSAAQKIATRRSPPSTDIIPWQAIIKYREQTLPRAAKEDIVHRFGMSHRAGAQNRQQLLTMERIAFSQQQHNRLGLARDKKARLLNPDLQARWETLVSIKTLRRDPAVVFAEPNYRVHALAVPNDTAYPTQWHYPLINLPAAWDMTTGVPEVIVAVIDTGILAGHPDLAGQTVPGYDFIRDPASAGDGNGIDPNPEDTGDGGSLGGSSFHGTHVSGTIAAASNNGFGVAGVAWNARIMPLRVLGIEGGTSYDVNQALRYAAGLPNDSGTLPEQRADIINLSLGGGGFSQSEQALYNDLRDAGVIVVAAAGNEGSRNFHYPSSYDGVISVSAVDIQRHITSYSNFGSDIDIAAPGGDNGTDVNGDGFPDGILSTGASSNGFVYSFLAGTSMASPHVAGVLALMKSVNTNLSPEDIDALLENGDLTDDLGNPGRDDQYGHGMINAERAVSAALTASGKPPADNPRIGASSSLLNFSSAANSLDLAIQNRGSGELQLAKIDSSEDWLSVTPQDTDTNGLGLYKVVVDRDGLGVGVYGGQITVSSSINTITINVLMSVIDENAGGNVGQLYLLLVKPDFGEIVAQLEVSGNSGLYRYQFQDIPTGSYELHAGSDTDNDFFICDAGEACGSYLTADQPIVIELEADTHSIDFPIEFLVNIPTVNASNSAGTDTKISRRAPESGRKIER
ncbi:MAG: S8 family peptidase, partial [Proteobacteria bacterium]|nr:S8 family peptidase [Pseudomonadota bacterium]